MGDQAEAGPDAWDALGERFARHYSSLRGRVRTHVVDAHLGEHLPPPPLRIVDIGGGAGDQSLPLAARSYDLTIVDPSPAMLERARQRAVDNGLDHQIRLVEAAGEDAFEALAQEVFGGVLCHGVLMYLDDPSPMLDALSALAAPGGMVSIVAKNVEAMAMLPAAMGDWATTLAAFDSDHQVNGLGVVTRGDHVDVLSDMLRARGVDPVAWYGVRLFTDAWRDDRAAVDPDELVLAAELEASRRDPYRQLSRLFHLVSRRR